MKKTLLLLASLACFGLLVSCKQPTDSAANKENVSYNYAGTASGTITVEKLNGAVPSPVMELNVTIDSDKFANINYDDKAYVRKENSNSSSSSNSEIGDYIVKTNTKNYSLSVPVKVTYKDNQGELQTSNTSLWLNIQKIGDEYYCNGKKITVTGSLEDETFSLSGIEYSNYTYFGEAEGKIKTIDFKRK